MAYLGIDIGGTKTLVCRLGDNGVIESQERFETPQDYSEFKQRLAVSISQVHFDDVHAVGVGAPGFIDRQSGDVIQLGNLPWQNIPLRQDIESLTHKPVVIENDAKLAGLSEAMLLKKTYRRVLYVTISTGIGVGLTIDGVIDTHISDGGGKSMLFEHNDKLVAWEDFASGRAIHEEFGQQASEIDDPDIWREVSRRLAIGFIELIDLTGPEVIVIGGGVGAHYDKFKTYFDAELQKYKKELLTIPPIIQAQRPEQAVIYGCYDLVKSTHGRPN